MDSPPSNAISEAYLERLKDRVDPSYLEYFSRILKEVERAYEIASEARKKKLDPEDRVECELTFDLADRVEKLVGPPGIAKRIRELSKVIPSREKLALKIVEEVTYRGIASLEDERKVADQALRTGLAILTDGVTVAPVEGISDVRIKRNPDNSRYLAVYFAGPIRPAGGTEQALTIVLADYIRRLIGLDRYKPTKEEVARFIEEVRLYERVEGREGRKARFQYKTKDSVLEYVLWRLPVEVTGPGTIREVVPSYAKIPRIETDYIRQGALLVVNDGLIGRAAKVLKAVQEMGISGWEWLSRVSASKGEGTSRVEEVIAGRPIFANISREGFRLRYGRARNTGLCAVGIHPATMAILDDFLAVGTQIRVDYPGKSAITVPVDTVEPPVVKLKDGSVVRVRSYEEGVRLRDQVERVLFLGDLLVSFGDFLENNCPLKQPGYTEEEWALDLEEALSKVEEESVDIEKARAFISDPLGNVPSWKEAFELSRKLGVPLHPRYTYFWEKLGIKELKRLREGLLSGEVSEERIVVEREKVELFLDELCVPYSVENGRIVVEGDDARALYWCLALRNPEKEVVGKDVFEAIFNLSGIRVRPKAPSRIEARMGRPEKAKPREMSPPVHVLFPVGPVRVVSRAIKEGRYVKVEVGKFKCPVCGNYSFYNWCERCGARCEVEGYCPTCGSPVNADRCPSCRTRVKITEIKRIDLKKMLEEAAERVGLRVSEAMDVKGVKGLMSREKIPERLEKGILRAKYKLTVCKDGTVRFSVTNAPLTHFRPREIGVSVEKLRELGYDRDAKGRELEEDGQLCELKVQDIIIPAEAADFLVRVCQFVDDLLVRFYGMEPYYRVRGKEDLVGKLVVGLSPHTSVGVVGRVIGFTRARVCYAHPLWHAAKRRDCDGDEDAIMMLMDVLLNFSRKFLPAQAGGMMDAPLFLLPLIVAEEVDDQAHNLDVAERYPRELYRASREGLEPKEVREVEVVRQRLGTPLELAGYRYTHETSDISAGNVQTAYTRLEEMGEKMKKQMELMEKLKGVDMKAVIEGILDVHLLRDIAGNLRAFFAQSFRCPKCGTKVRRPTLNGKCPKCGRELILTAHLGGIEKYLPHAEKLVEEYPVDEYYRERVRLLKEHIDSLFRREAKLSEFRQEAVEEAKKPVRKGTLDEFFD